MSDIDLSKLTLSDAKIIWEYVDKARDRLKPEAKDFAPIEKFQDALKEANVKAADAAELALVKRVAVAMISPIQTTNINPSGEQMEDARRVIAMVKENG